MRPNALRLYAFCLHEIWKTKSPFHPQSLAVHGDLAWTWTELDCTECNESPLLNYLWLYAARKRVLGKNHPATAGALLGIERISNSERFHYEASQSLDPASVSVFFRTIYVLQEAMLGGAMLTMDVLTTRSLLQQMDPQSMSEDTLVKYLKLLDDIAEKYLMFNTNRALEYSLFAIKTSEKYLGEYHAETLWRYEKLGDYFETKQDRQALELYYKALAQSGIQSQKAGVLKQKFFKVLVRCILEEPHQDGKPMEYLNSTLNSLIDHDWFKNLLIFLNGEVKLLKGQYTEAYPHLKLASDWVKVNTDNSNGHRVGLWPVFCIFHFARSHFALGTALFRMRNEEEAIKKGLDALELCEHSESCFQGFLWFKFEVLKVLLLWHTSGEDEVAVFGHQFGGISAHGHHIQDSWWIDLWYEAQSKWYELGAGEKWRKHMILLECFRTDRSKFCHMRRSIFDDFMCSAR